MGCAFVMLVAKTGLLTECFCFPFLLGLLMYVTLLPRGMTISVTDAPFLDGFTWLILNEDDFLPSL